MNSLRTRIALSCALLLIGVIAILSLFFTLAFRTILYEQTKQRVDGICDQITRFAERSDPTMIFGGPDSPEAELTDTHNLDHWSSPSTFIQVDESRENGRDTPLGKSNNLGPIALSPDQFLRTPGRRLYREAVNSVGHLFVADEMIALPTGMVVLHVAESLDLIDNTLARMQFFSILAVAIAIPLSLITSFVISTNAIKPIHDLTATMREVGSDRLDRRVGIERRTDELGELARTFDEMLDRLQASFLRERRFIADASHELKTPLTVINANAQMLRRWAQSDEAIRSESIEAIVQESGGLSRLIEELLLLARSDSGDAVIREPVDVAVIAEELVAAAMPRVTARSLSLRLEFDGERNRMTILGNPLLIRRVLANILDNAVKYTETGEIVVCLRRLPWHVECAVLDTGVGIPADERERVFERLYRIDASRSRQTEGFGLGLSIARAFVKIHRGWIRAEGRPEGGTVIRMRFPVDEPHLS